MAAYDAIVIGAGPAGLTAAIYLQRAGLQTLVLEELIYGGQMANTPEVENYPAVGKVSGAQLGMNLYNQAISHGAQVQLDGVVKASLSGEEKTVETQSGERHTTKTIIIANGAKRRKLGIPGEEEYAGRGVSYCATCDGGFFKGKTTAVVGGGNTAVEDALYLANLCETVYLVHRRGEFRASKILADSLHKRENIKQVLYAVPLEITLKENGQTVGGLSIKDVRTEEESKLTVDGVFVAVGLVPDNTLFADQLTLDKAGYIVAGEDTKTNLPGVFVAGDTRTKSLRQIVTAAGDGAVAAFEAGNYLSSL